MNQNRIGQKVLDIESGMEEIGECVAITNDGRYVLQFPSLEGEVFAYTEEDFHKSNRRYLDSINWGKIERVCVVDDAGRAYDSYGINAYPSVQDDGRTIKIIVTNK